MEVKCISNSGENSELIVPRNAKQKIGYLNYVSSHEVGYTISSEIVGYLLTPEKTYKVYGVMIINSSCRYLIFDDEKTPLFFPSELFECIETTLPFDSHFFVHDTQDFKIFISGPDFLSSYDSLADLIDLVPSAVTKVIEYKEYLNTWGFD